MYTSKELKEIYEGRYGKGSLSNGKRENQLYAKYRRLLMGKMSFEKVLDLGCGLAYKTIGFTKSDEQVLAIDLSENAIAFCQSQFEIKNIDFKAADAFDLQERFNLITAFGFSLFNTKNTDEFIRVFQHFYKENLIHAKQSCVVIGSFTDFSGRGEDSWYLHTKKDLADIIRNLEDRFSVKAQVYFPHRHIGNYVGFGLYNFVAEIVKLVVKRKRTFFIHISYE